MSLFIKQKKKNVFTGKNKAKRYLKKTGEGNLTVQIELLRIYVSGELEAIINKYKFDLVEVYVDGNYKRGLDLQVNIQNRNKNIGIDFLESHYETCFYLSGCTPEDVENSIKVVDYSSFKLDSILNEVDIRLNC